MTSVLAQVQPPASDPDLTRPFVVIAVCAFVIILTVLIQVVGSRRRGDAAPTDDVESPQ